MEKTGRRFFDNMLHYSVIALGIAFFVKGFIPLSKIAIAKAPLPSPIKAAYIGAQT